MDRLKNIRKSLLQYTFLFLLIGITIYLVFKTLDIKMLSNVMVMVDKKFLFIGALAIMCHIMLEGVVMKIIIESTHKVNIRFIGFKLAIMGFYYNLITPFASGSQPVQIYVLKKCKMPLSKASAVVTNKSIIFQIVVTFYCTILVLMNFAMLEKQMKMIMPLVFLGIAINSFVLIMIILVILNPKKIKYFMRITIKHLSKIKFLKFLDSKIESIESFIDDYSKAINFFAKNKKVLISTIIVTFIQLSAYFSVSFWIYKAFNLQGYSYIYILTLQAFLYMAISPIPTPGNVGANELAFFTIFKSVFPQPLMGYAVFLYGGFMYYLILIGSGIFTVITHYRMKNRIGRNIVLSEN